MPAIVIYVEPCVVMVATLYMDKFLLGDGFSQTDKCDTRNLSEAQRRLSEDPINCRLQMPALTLFIAPVSDAPRD